MPGFLEAFPSVEALASAPEDRLMKLWEGLGYYSRAKNLQKAARIVAEMGAFPDTYEGLLALPGIGDYTASAIASAAFGRREAAVDGNVLRVVTRLTDCHDDILDPRTKRHVREQLQHVMPAESARVFNQATMELGGHSVRAQRSAQVRRMPGSGLLPGPSARHSGNAPGQGP